MPLIPAAPLWLIATAAAHDAPMPPTAALEATFTVRLRATVVSPLHVDVLDDDELRRLNVSAEPVRIERHLNTGALLRNPLGRYPTTQARL